MTSTTFSPSNQGHSSYLMTTKFPSATTKLWRQNVSSMTTSRRTDRASSEGMAPFNEHITCGRMRHTWWSRPAMRLFTQSAKQTTDLHTSLRARNVYTYPLKSFLKSSEKKIGRTITTIHSKIHLVCLKTMSNYQALWTALWTLVLLLTGTDMVPWPNLTLTAWKTWCVSMKDTKTLL